MRRSIGELQQAYQPLMEQAMDALRRYHEGLNEELTAVEVQRLRLLAESAFEAVNDFQRRALQDLVGPAEPLHREDR